MDTSHRTDMATTLSPTTTEDLGEAIHLDSPITEIFITIDVLFILIALIGNSLIIAAAIRNKFLRTPQILYIISVAIAHILVGILVLPMFIFGHHKHDHMSAGVCKVFAYATKFSCSASLFSIIPVTIDSFLRNKGHYQEKPLTWQQSIWQVALTWVVAALYAIVHCFYVDFHIEVGEDNMGKWHTKMCHIAKENFYNHKMIIMVDFVLLFIVPVLLLAALVCVILCWDKKGLIAEPQCPQERKRRRLSIHSSVIFLVVFTLFNIGNYLLSVYIFWGPGNFRRQHLLTGAFALIGFCMSWVNVVMLMVFNRTFRETILGRNMKSEVEPKNGVNSHVEKKNGEIEGTITHL